jgi:putative PIN family toxin of toxin-antitoxin system
MIRVVIDTSTLVSAVISPTGPNAQVLELIVAAKIRPYVNDAVIEEYERVFDYEHLRRLDRRRVANVIRLVKAAAVRVRWWPSKTLAA